MSALAFIAGLMLGGTVGALAMALVVADRFQGDDE